MTKASLDHVPSLSERLVGGPVGFRRWLERLGPTFIKVGQYLALRPDLVPQAYCDELMKLLDRVPPFAWAEARAIVAQDLGGDPNEIFAYVNPRPIAAGSLAQTHAARLLDGTEVAVKIQRPNIRSTVLRDLGRARMLARVLDRSGASLIADPNKIVHELTAWMLQEIDFSRELSNMARLYRLAVDSPYERVPRPYPALSSSRVLTAEYLRGISLSELLLASRSDHPDDVARVEALNIDRDRVAANLLAANLRQIFRYQFFHADLHPGNLFVLPDNVIGFVDFGLCDELDQTIRDRQLRYLTAGYSGQAEQMFRALTDLLIPGEQTDMEAFRRDFLAETRGWMGRRQTSEQRATSERAPGVDLERSPVAQYLVGLMRAARRHELQVPTRILSMYRALLTADAVAHQLGSGADLESVGRTFFTRLRAEEALRALEPERLQPTFLSLLELLHDSPGQLRQVLADLSDGNFTLSVYTLEAPRVAHVRNRRVRLLATAILSVSIALLVAIQDLPAAFGVSLRWLLGGVLIVLYLWIYLQWRMLR